MRAWPDAPVYTSLYDETAVGDLVPKGRVHTSWLARLPGANRYFRYLAPFYPRAFESIDLSAYDTVLSSSSAWAKGVVAAPGAVHVCYLHTVSRFVFAYDEYLGGFGMRAFARPAVERLVRWDSKAAQRPDAYIANSRVVAERVRRYYGRDAQVVHPPVDLDRFSLGAGSGDYFFIASRLLPYKRIDRAILAAKSAGVRLLVAGAGPALGTLRDLARDSTTTLLGFVDDARVNELMGNARAVILPGEGDYGL
ncbi:MAG: glycosyltransferase, partial [Vulcanimicrobiaceae bacterium]